MFDTADVYSETRAESILGESLKWIRHESIELFLHDKKRQPRAAAFSNYINCFINIIYSKMINQLMSANIFPQ
ncbi:hypothetical protein P4307_24850 [Brevibacillus porteri]|nr:hypothetical protein [Brevibacillus porteri]MED1799660.1 hypothetical protein [Brevibacillus porteri]MED2133100.1 hypothetical protein [Brevibacillus porteri]MED2747398.1 hypothetical protein [Brevibacillus porteri]MED2813847.1 hypothetical protein [Brevibacillus porteri]MED2893036.1 hypothetical protein [Brevibacillus porteri]